MRHHHTYKILNHCIGCTKCGSMAPAVFELDVTRGVAVVKAQPGNASDQRKSFFALKSCPVSAIQTAVS